MRLISKGFTLIELLIVVAIIAILAAIAVPNFLEAQTRSKVSRVKADQRSLATAAEAYYIDWNSYPPNDNGPTGWVDSAGSLELEYFAIPLSTPVAYITNAMHPDPFYNAQAVGSGESDHFIVEETGTSVNWLLNISESDVIAEPLMTLAVTDPGKRELMFGLGFLLVSAGPDRSYEVQRLSGFANPSLDLEPEHFVTWFGDMASLGGINEIYDPTNGTVSQGELMRSRKGVMEGQHLPAGAP